MSRTGRYKALILSLFAVGIVGAVLLPAWMRPRPSWRPCATWWSLGWALAGRSRCWSWWRRNAFPDRNLGEVTAGSRFFRQMGSTSVRALWGPLLSVWFAANVQQRLPAQVRDALGRERLAEASNPEALSRLRPWPRCGTHWRRWAPGAGRGRAAGGDPAREPGGRVARTVRGYGRPHGRRLRHRHALAEIPLRKTRDADLATDRADAAAPTVHGG